MPNSLRLEMVRNTYIQPVSVINVLTVHPGLVVWSLVEILANMDLARLSELNVDKALNALRVEPWSSPAERPGDFTARE